MVNNVFMGQLTESDNYHSSTPMKKLDTIDQKILVLLGQDGRMSCSTLARKLNTGRETITYHLKKMKDMNFLHGRLTLIDTRRLGFRNYLAYIKFTGLQNSDNFDNFISELIEKKEITRIKNCSGVFDLQLTICVRTPEELIYVIECLTQKHHPLIQTYELLEILNEDFLGLSLLSVSEKKTLFSPPSPIASKKPFTVDAKDLTLLDIIKLDGDISLLELSRRVELAPIAVRNRLKKLQSANIIKCYIPLASLDQLGYQWWKVLIKCKNLTPETFITYVKLHPNILWYMKLLGRWDYQISIFARNNADFHRTLDELRSHFINNIVNYDTLIIFNQLKFVQRIR